MSCPASSMTLCGFLRPNKNRNARKASFILTVSRKAAAFGLAECQRLALRCKERHPAVTIVMVSSFPQRRLGRSKPTVHTGIVWLTSGRAPECDQAHLRAARRNRATLLLSPGLPAIIFYAHCAFLEPGSVDVGIAPRLHSGLDLGRSAAGERPPGDQIRACRPIRYGP